MGWDWCYLAIFLVPVVLLVLSLKNKSSSQRLPPGPPGWPIFGNLFDMGSMPHRSIAGMKLRYGPVVWLKIGSVKTMAILSAKVAAEFFKNHDGCFPDRKIVDMMRVHNYNEGSMVIAPYGSYWRALRRISTVEMFTNKKIHQTVHLRRKSIDSMLRWIDKEAKSEGAGGIEVARFMFLASFNLMGNLMLSRDLVDPESRKASEFFIAMRALTECCMHPNISDIFPYLRWFDLQGIRKKSERHMRKALEIASTFVKERLEENKRGGEGKKKDFLEVLLEFEGTGKDEPAKLSQHQINIFILEMFLVGTESTSSSVEWVLTELLCNPEAMNRVKAEINEVVGPNRRFEESDIEHLPYMQAVVKETLRLHPPVPLLIPRRAIQHTSFMGYEIPEDTQVFVNAWAIGRDPECWQDDLSAFKPERFLHGSKSPDFKGQNFEFIPFGAGRRICPGLTLGTSMMHLFVGSFLHTYDWELPPNVTPSSMDMKDKMGMTVRKLQPLKAIPILKFNHFHLH